MTDGRRNPSGMKEHPFLPYNITEPRVIKGYPEKFQVSGRMIGGCMDCLVNLIGTKS